MTHATSSHLATHAALRAGRPFSYWTSSKVTPYKEPEQRKPLIVHTTPPGAMLGTHRS